MYQEKEKMGGLKVFREAVLFNIILADTFNE